MEYKEFENKLLDWAKERQLIESKTRETKNELTKSKQLCKLMEEVGELATDFNKRARNAEHQRHLVDSFGDTLVTLVIFAQQNGLSMEECWDKAWSHIANRTGETVDGTFIADKDRDDK